MPENKELDRDLTEAEKETINLLLRNLDLLEKNLIQALDSEKTIMDILKQAQPNQWKDAHYNYPRIKQIIEKYQHKWQSKSSKGKDSKPSRPYEDPIQQKYRLK